MRSLPIQPGPPISRDPAAGRVARRGRWGPALLVMLLVTAGAWSGGDFHGLAETRTLPSPGGALAGGEGQGEAAAARVAATPPAGELSREAQAEQRLRLRQRRAARRERLERVLAERGALEQDLATLQRRILETERELAVFAGDLAEHQRALRGLEEHAARLRRGGGLLRERLGQGLRRLYKEYKLDALHPGGELRAARLLRQARYAAEVAGADLQLLYTYQAARDALRAAQERFAERTAAIETLRQTSAERLRELVDLRRRKEQLLVALVDERSEIVASIQDFDTALARLGEPAEAPSPPPDAAPQPPLAHPDGEATPGAARRETPAAAAEDFAALKGTLPWPATGRLLPRPPIAGLPALPDSPTAQEAPRAAEGAPPQAPGTTPAPNLNGGANGAPQARQETGAAAGSLALHKREARLQSIQISVEPGAPVRSVAPGVVQFADLLPGYGKLLIIHHGKGYHSLYANLGTILVRVGDQVETLQLVGEAVRQPATPPPALYFELRFHGIPENPLHWLADKPAS